MKKFLIALLIMLPLIAMASGLHVHINNSTIIGTKIIEYFIESNHPDAWLISGYSPVFLNEFMSGALFPDVNREVALQRAFPDIWYRGNSLILSKCSADIKKDLHTSGASLLYEVFNDDNFFGVYQSRLEFYRTFFFLLGIECHNLEDLYVDLIWHPGTSDLYGYGAFTNLTLPWEFSSTFNAYHAFDDVESYLDAVAGFSPLMNALYFDKNNEINYTNNTKLIDIIHTTVDEELFFDLFMNGNEAHVLELAYFMTLGPVGYIFTSNYIVSKFMFPILNDFWMNQGYLTKNNCIEFQLSTLKKLVELEREKRVYNSENNMIRLYNIEWTDIPSILYSDYRGYKDKESITNNNLNISSWSAQNNRCRNELIKKSLISQLYNERNMALKIPNVNQLKEKYVNIPEIMVYQTYFVVDGNTKNCYDNYTKLVSKI